MEWKAVDLPVQRYPHDTQINSAYQIICRLEHRILKQEPSANRVNGIRHARILGQLIIQAPTDERRHIIACKILGCREDPQILLELAKL